MVHYVVDFVMTTGVDFVVTHLSWFVMNNVNFKLWQMHVVNFDMDLWWIWEWISVSVEPVHKTRMVIFGVDFGVCWGAGGTGQMLSPLPPALALSTAAGHHAIPTSNRDCLCSPPKPAFATAESKNRSRCRMWLC